jgi:hypothetical protein
MVAGGGLIFFATRATATVGEGTTFVKWMLAVFAAFVVLASIPLLAGS